MSDENTKNETEESNPAAKQQDKQKQTGASLLASVRGELKKAKADKVKGQLRELVKQKEEHDKNSALVDENISKILADYDSDLI